MHWYINGKRIYKVSKWLKENGYEWDESDEMRVIVKLILSEFMK